MKHSQFQIINADCREAMAAMDADSVDSIVCDPPYGLSFMGKGWDHGVPGVEFWQAALRVVKPGGHLLAFGGTRTFHRLMVAIEDAGWELRDTIGWIYGSGFPKSLDVSKAIDKAAGAEREVVGFDASRARPNRQYEGGAIGNIGGTGKVSDRSDNGATLTAPATDAAKQWEGWGTALKPAWEPIVVARKPLIGTVAENVLRHGTGGMNIDGCRVAGEVPRTVQGQSARSGEVYGEDQRDQRVFEPHEAGRWPANLIHDGSEEVLAAFPQAPGQQGATAERKQGNVYSTVTPGEVGIAPRADAGSAARFFYCAKAAKKDRGVGNNHPTVKPSALMRYLCRLVTPPGGLVLDPFCGSGSTGKAAVLEGFRFVGVEQDSAYAAVAIGRIEVAAETSGDKVAG